MCSLRIIEAISLSIIFPADRATLLQIHFTVTLRIYFLDFKALIRCNFVRGLDSLVWW